MGNEKIGCLTFVAAVDRFGFDGRIGFRRRSPLAPSGKIIDPGRDKGNLGEALTRHARGADNAITPVL